MTLTKLFMMTTAKGPKQKKVDFIFLLEAETTKGKYTKYKLGTFDEPMSDNEAELRVLLEALKILKKPCDIEIYADNNYLINGLNGWVEKWQENDWKNAKGKEVPHKDIWIEVLGWLKSHKYSLREPFESHEYRKWMYAELERSKRG